MPEMLDRKRPFTAEDSCWLPRSRKSPGAARRLLVDLLAKVEGGHRFTDVGLLVVSELVTNAVVHGTPRERLVWLWLKVDADVLRIEVHDARGDRAPELRAAAADEESGRGLALVKFLALKWGCCPRRNVGKTVWVECGPSEEQRP